MKLEEIQTFMIFATECVCVLDRPIVAGARWLNERQRKLLFAAAYLEVLTMAFVVIRLFQGYSCLFAWLSKVIAYKSRQLIFIHLYSNVGLVVVIGKERKEGRVKTLLSFFLLTLVSMYSLLAVYEP